MSDLSGSSEPSDLSGYVLAPGVTVERVGSECLALVGREVVRVTGPAARLLAAMQPGEVSVVGVAADAGEVHPALDLLVDLGVLERTSASVATPATVSRRRALGVAAGGAALGATVLVLPQAAAATSDAAEGQSVNTGGTAESTTTTTVPAALTLSFAEEEEALTVSWTEGS